jgi:lipopolysaccharide transport system permease protein/teichoic acid transport system permease protein
VNELLTQRVRPGISQIRNSLFRIVAFLAKLYRYKEVIWAMAARDIAARYVGTFGGMVWAIVHPLATVIIYWFVFSVGFKAQGPAGMPFVLYFVSGLVPWLFFSEVLGSSINAVTANAHLVKKTVFPAEILPIVHLISASFVHLIMIVVLSVLGWHYGYGPSLTSIQVVYYYGALGCFVLGLSWLVGSLQVFHRDVGQAMIVALGLWFWLTPVVWSAEMIPVPYRSILEYNPIYYVVEGYRGSLITDQAAWMNWRGGLRFWAITGPVFLLGAYVFRRLKPDFADVL